MKRKNKIIVACSISVLMILVVVTRVILKNEYKVVIQNNTNENIQDLELIYSKTGDITKRVDVDARDFVECILDTNDVEGENVVFLRYKDIHGNSHDEIIIGYLESGYSGHVRVAIHSLDEDKKLDLDVEVIY